MAPKKGSRRPARKKNRGRSTPKLTKLTARYIRAAGSIKQAAAEIARHSAKIADHVAEITNVVQTDPIGSCKYVDKLGQLQCESPVTQSYCMGIPGGHFRENGSCP
jgi:hypothetical protein